MSTPIRLPSSSERRPVISVIFSPSLNGDSRRYAAELTHNLTMAKRGLRPVRDTYDLLWAYYWNEPGYDAVRQLATELYGPNTLLRTIRNPVHAVVEFYSSTLWPGAANEAIPLTDAKQPVIDAIGQVWLWSNWAARKQVAARWTALLGDLFLKVVLSTDKQRVYFQLIDPSYVSDFDTDERGYLTYIRIDVPQTERRGDEVRAYTLVEVWSKAEQVVRQWRADQADKELRDLGAPALELPLSTWKIDFVPVVHGKFRDIGQDRGQSAVIHALRPIDELNRACTRLHDMLFRYGKADRALVGAGRSDEGFTKPPRFDQAEDVQIGEETFYRLPAGWDLKDLVAPVPYGQALEIVEAHQKALETYYLPELIYYRISEFDNLSGRALRFMMTAAIDRVIEARANAEDALIRANKMALTLGKNAGLFDLPGSYEDGSFDHAIEEREIIPLTGLEAAQAELAEAQAKIAKQQVTDPLFLEEMGYTPQEVQKILSNQQVTTDQVGGALLRNLERGQARTEVVSTPTGDQIRQMLDRTGGAQ